MTKKYSNSDLMKIAVEEHLKCTEYPKVGVVVAKDGKILSTGFRGEVPRTHAERVALEKLAMLDRIGSTVFTTLEPCVALQADQATESCADLIIASGIREVFVGVLDPNGTIYSQGFRKLLENNISVKFFNRKLRDAVEYKLIQAALRQYVRLQTGGSPQFDNQGLKYALRRIVTTPVTASSEI